MPPFPHEPSPDAYGFRTFVLNFKATHLPSMDFLSPSDGYVVLYEKNTTNVDQKAFPTHPSDITWVRLGHTEVIMDVASPCWEKTLTLELNEVGLQNCELRLEVWDADDPDLMDMKEQDLIGEVQFNINIFGPNIVGTVNLPLEKNGKPVISKGNPPACLTISIDEYPANARKACVTMEHVNMQKQSDDCVVQFLQVKNDSGVAHAQQQYTHPSLFLERHLIVHQTPITNGVYSPFQMSEDRLYHITSSQQQKDTTPIVSDNPAFSIISQESLDPSEGKEFEIRLVKFKDTMSTTVIGTARLPAIHTTLATQPLATNATATTVKLMNPDSKKRNEQTASLLIKNWRSQPNTPTFNNYLDSGLKFKLNFAIDCSGSNQKQSSGLHQLNSDGENQYTWAIRDLADGLVRGLGGMENISGINAFGFGGQVVEPHTVNPTVKYALTPTKDVACDSIDDISKQYGIFTKIPFASNVSTRTRFAPFLSHFDSSVITVKEDIVSIDEKNYGALNVQNPTYNILVILTDGEVQDQAEMLQVLYNLSLKPVSIIFVGIGHDKNHKFTDLLQFNTDQRGALRVDKHMHIARQMTHFFPYLFFIKSTEYIKIKLARSIQAQVVNQFFLANKFPVKKHSRSSLPPPPPPQAFTQSNQQQEEEHPGFKIL